MKRLFVNLVILLFGVSMVWAQSGPQPEVFRSVRNDKSPPLRELAKNIPPPQPGPLRIIPLMPSPYAPEPRGPMGLDPALQDQPGTLRSSIPVANWEGISNQDNNNVLGFPVIPPDPNIDVGPNHVVQMVNLIYAIYNKEGDLLLGPLPNSVLWAGLGGFCQTNSNSDPIVLYDHLADRWIVNMIAWNSTFTSFSTCYAVSETGDPTGSYFRYEFAFGSDLPDYPKLGVWPDAYYATFRVFNSNFTSLDMVAGALERDSMLVGAPAQMMLYSITDRLFGIDGVIAADLDGPPPPAGTPGYFVGYQDAQNRLFTFDLTVDWATPANSTFTGPNFLSVDPFSSNLCGFSRDCIPQPNTNEGLDPIENNIMHRLAFRNFGSHMSMVANHTVDVDGNDHAGVRWYELRDEGAGWTIFQQGTYAPDSDHRWMGSIAMDNAGNIALSYSVSSSATFPSIRYTGHTADGPLGVMNLAEVSIFEGTGSQTSDQNRWGDYTMLTPDPSADGTFWLTNEYYAITSSFNWRTRIAAFIFKSGLKDIAVSPVYVRPGIDSVLVSAAALDPAGLSLFARIESPDGISLDTLELFDDGAHGDGLAGDSVYAVIWPVPSVEERVHYVDLLINVADTDTFSFDMDNVGLFTSIGPVVFETLTLFPDTILNAADRFLFKLVLGNNGLTAAATGVSAILTSVDACVAAVIRSKSNYGDIASGTTAVAIGTYLIELTENCTGEQEILFDISIASDGKDFWTDSFTLRPRLVRESSALPSFVASGVDSVILTSLASVSAGLSLFAEIESPDDVPIDTIELFDDGAHNDGDAGDNLFGNAWRVPPVEELHYFVDIQVTIDDTISFGISNAASFTKIGPVVFESLTLFLDTIPNPGDRMISKLTLRNDGSTATATEVSANISTSDTCVTNILEISPIYGDIDAGTAAISSGSYVVDFNENCAGGESILFDISIVSEEIHYWSDNFSISLVPIGIADEGAAIPESYSLAQNYPNPFNPVTVIKYALPIRSEVSLIIYNLLGQEVRRWDIQGQTAGYHQVTWNASGVAS